MGKVSRLPYFYFLFVRYFISEKYVKYDRNVASKYIKTARRKVNAKSKSVLTVK